MKRYLIAFSLIFGSLSAIADEPLKNTDSPPPANGGVATQAAQSPQLPKLLIRWNCDGCEQNEKVPPQIEQAYYDEAAKNGYGIAGTETAEVVITKFRQRPPAARAMFGIMAGTDHLGVHVTYREKNFDASDYSANAWLGMNSLCESVARQSYEKLLAAVRGEPATPASP